MGKRTRANGEGAIFFRKKDERWVAELIIGHEPVTGPDGKPVLDENGLPKVRRKVIRGSFRTKTEAKNWLAEKVKDLKNGTLVEPSKQTAGEFIQRWLETTVAHEVKASTLRIYRELFEDYIQPKLGSVPIQKLTPQQAQEFLHTLLQSGKSARTVQLVHGLLSRACRRAVELGLLVRNPMDAVRKPRLEQKEFQALTPEQLARFLEAAKEDRLHALFYLLALSGLRIGEALALRWQDVDLENGTLTVTQTMERVNGKPTFSTPKTKASRAPVDLPAEAVAALRRWRLEQAEELLRIGIREPELVFTTQTGAPIHRSNVRNRHFQPILARAGLPRTLRIHDLRHTYVTMLISAGANPKVVQEMARHANIQVTLGTYAHVFREQKKEAARKLDELLAAAKTKTKQA